MDGNNTTICIAPGESLTPEDVEFCKGKAKVYVVNDCYKIAPWADVLYAADTSWWDHHKGAPEFTGQKWTVSQQAADKFKLNYIAGYNNKPWGDTQDGIATGGNSGFQALNLAALHGAQRVILLGYNYGFTHKKHYFGDHPPEINRPSNYKEWLTRLEMAAKYIKIPVINCSRESAIKCFPRLSLEEALCP